MEERVKGLDWPLIGITMVGQRRLVNVEWALRFVISNKVPGDLIECGVWRGGTSLFARAVLKSFDVTDRHVWLADSFEGLPKARTKNDDKKWSQMDYLKVRDVSVKFSKIAHSYMFHSRFHWQKLKPTSVRSTCSMVRCISVKASSLIHCLDATFLRSLSFGSTMDQLFNLYAKLQIGGVLIVDDYTIPE
jgi:hypothetical protein